MARNHDTAQRGFSLAGRGARHGSLACARRSSRARREQVCLAETLDRVLNKGAVIAGDITISVADIDLLYLGVHLVLTSVETMRRWDHDARRVQVCAGAAPRFTGG